MPEPKADALYFDNTRVSSYFKCPRLFYFRHVRNWRSDKKKSSLAFGAGIHAAMEEVWANPHEETLNLLAMASNAFDKKWVEEGFSLEQIDMGDKRNPGNAADILHAYITHYTNWLQRIELIANEQPFIVPLMRTMNDNREVLYIGRWDKVYKDQGKLYVGEHKTTSLYRVATKFAQEWLQSFSPDNQVDGYSFAGLAAFGEALKGVMVDGILVHKSVRAFTRVPVQRSFQNLDAWAWETRYWITEILDNVAMLEELRQDGEKPAFLPCFPKRTEHCQHKYGQCSMLDVCKYGNSNPELIADPPKGFVVEVWDPFAHNTEGGKEPIVVGVGGVTNVGSDAEESEGAAGQGD